MAWRFLVASMLAALSIGARAQPALQANATGLWWHPAEPGWAVSVAQQGNTIVATLLLHDREGRATWLFAPEATLAASTYPFLSFSGNLYETSGSWYGGAFDATRAQVKPVGTLTFAVRNGIPPQPLDSARLTYTANGVTVARDMVPFTFRTPSMAGRYSGAVTWLDDEFCPASRLPHKAQDVLEIDFALPGSNPRFVTWDTAGNHCVFEGSARPNGRLLEMDGTYVCYEYGTLAKRAGGRFALTNLVSEPFGFTGDGWILAETSPAACFTALRIGGAKY